MYSVKCYEEVQGYGPVCWYGEKEYKFNSVDEAQRFIDERSHDSAKCALLDEDGKPTGQYLVTMFISEISE